MTRPTEIIIRLIEKWNNISRITVDPDKCGGRPCIRELRIRVKDILEMLASGMTNEEILHDFPYLEAEDISAALDGSFDNSDRQRN